MEVNRGIYLLRPKGAVYSLSENNPNRIDKAIKVNFRFVKFGKTEISFEKRKKDYQKIFGEKFIFQPVLYVEDLSKIKKIEQEIKILLSEFLVVNPKTNRKLEWFKDIPLITIQRYIVKKFIKNNH